MQNKQTTSDSLHPPVIAGVSTGGENRGFFLNYEDLLREIERPTLAAQAFEDFRNSPVQM
jgi:hypothetical protein